MANPRNAFRLVRFLSSRTITKPLMAALADLRKSRIRVLPDILDNRLAAGGGAFVIYRFMREWLSSEMLTRHQGEWVINSLFPTVPGPAYERAIEDLCLKREHSPVVAYLALTGECNNSCWYCNLEGRKQGQLTTREWLDIIDNLNALGTCVFALTGGEPLLRDDLGSIVNAASKHGMPSILITGGEGLTQERADALADAGLWGLWVRLDDYREKAEDQARGQVGAFQQAIDAIRMAKRAGLYVMIRTVASREFVDYRRFVPLHALAAHESVDEMRIEEPKPCGKLVRGAEMRLLERHHIEAIRAFHRDINSKGKTPKVCAMSHMEAPEMLGCLGGLRHLFIDPAGGVYPCEYSPLRFGNALTEPLALIWRRLNRSIGRGRRYCLSRTYNADYVQHLEDTLTVRPSKSEEFCKRMDPYEPQPAYYTFLHEHFYTTPKVDDQRRDVFASWNKPDKRRIDLP